MDITLDAVRKFLRRMSRLCGLSVQSPLLEDSRVAPLADHFMPGVGAPLEHMSLRCVGDRAYQPALLASSSMPSGLLSLKIRNCNIAAISRLLPRLPNLRKVHLSLEDDFATHDFLNQVAIPASSCRYLTEFDFRCNDNYADQISSGLIHLSSVCTLLETLHVHST